MFDIITIGSSLVDIFIHSNTFSSNQSEKGEQLCQLYGDKVELESFRIFTGGGASNTAVGFSRLGFKTATISETGRDDFAQLINHDFQREDVATNLLISEKKEQTGGSVILVGEGGRRVVMVHRGASSLLDTYDIPSYWLSKTKWIHLSSISGRKSTLEKIFGIIKHEEKIGLSWNPGKAELSLLAEKKLKVVNIPCQILILNKEEWEMIKAIQNEVLKLIPQVVITNGREGGDLYLEGVHSFKYLGGEKAVDTTGAGDSFATGYVAARIYNKSPKEAIEWGVRNASSVVSFYGAKTGLLRKEQIEANY